MQQNHLCNFGRGHQEEHFCEIILNLDQWFRRCCLKIFLILSSGDPFVQRSETICAILVDGTNRNHSLNFFDFGPVIQEEMSFKRSYLGLP